MIISVIYHLTTRINLIFMRNKINKHAWFLLLILLPAYNFAESGSILRGDTCFSNALFNTLLAVIILLLILAVALTQALKNIAQSDYLTKENEEKKDNTGLKTGAILLLTGFAYSANAEETLSKPNDWLIGGLDMFTFYFMVTIITIEVIFIVSLFMTMQYLLRKQGAKEVVAQKSKVISILEKLNASVEIENEEEIMLSHNYDGIKELDNDLPPWWKYGFYLTIVVAFIYLTHYHILHTGDLQGAEYNNEMQKAKADIAEYMKNAASNVDESSVKMLGEADIQSGKQIFVSTCSTCHGKFGEGGVGANLTDDYWIHGGSINDIFKTVKYGWPDKGMKSWKEDLSPMQIAQVSSYVKTLRGTNPPNPKAPQGDLYKEAAAANDSLKVGSDSTKTNLINDTIKKVVQETKHK